MNQTTNFLTAKVYLIGAGSGDPELLTVKAQKIITKANAIFYADSLVPKEILRDVAPTTELIPTANLTLETIIPMMIERVKANLAVVRLHSGDLSLYSAIHEQIQALVMAEVPFELVPGISAFQAAAAQLGVELTIPDLVQTIILTRVSGSASQVPSTEELSTLAAHQASLCLYLAARHVAKSQEQLLQHYSPETPVAVCFRVGWPDEKISIVPLKEMAAYTQAENLTRTTLYIVSPALANLQSPVATRSRLYHPEHSHIFRPRK